jgi:tetratricopeptide (TPR) repeat protein
VVGPRLSGIGNERKFFAEGNRMSRKIAISLISIFIFILTNQAPAGENFESAKKLFNADGYKEAIRLLKKVTKDEPSNAEAWVLLGDCYARLGKNKNAIRAYKKVIGINPEHADAIFRLGVNYTRLGNHSNAIEAYKEVIRIQPEHAEAYFYLGMSYDSIGRIGDAFEHYKILKTLDKNLADKLYKIILGSS